jgi:hypothetical protein
MEHLDNTRAAGAGGEIAAVEPLRGALNPAS